jgi:uncharacterized membrane protein YhaH (DUF805 family)
MLVPGMSEEAVKANLAQLFQCEAARIERLFSGEPCVMKSELSEAQADDYLAQLQAVGAVVQKVPEQQAKPTVPIAPSAKETPPVLPQTTKEDEAACDPDFRIFGFAGRLGRARYLAYILLTNMAALWLAKLFDPNARWLFLLFSFMFVIRRLHDFNWSGWWSLLLIGMSFAGIELMGLTPPVGNLWLSLLGMGLCLVSLLVLCLVPGTRGENAYGLPAPPNSWGVLIIAWALPALMIIGILAALVIPVLMPNSTLSEEEKKVLELEGAQVPLSPEQQQLAETARQKQQAEVERRRAMRERRESRRDDDDD